MRPLVRLALIFAAASGFLLALSLTASADVVEPSSAYQPASTVLLERGPGAGALPAEEGAAAGTGEASRTTTETREAEVAATPAPEHQVKPAPARVTTTSSAAQASALVRAMRPFGVGFERIGAYLGQVVSTCQVAAGSGAGVPVLALAVLSVVTALNRRRVFGVRPATDEDAPELLFATEVIAPG